MRHKKRRRVHFASRKLRILLAISLMATLLPLSAILKNDKAEAATFNVDTAVAFNGKLSNDGGSYVRRNSAAVIPNGAATIQAWFKADASAPSSAVIVSQGDSTSNFYIKRSNNNDIQYFYKGASAAISCGAIPTSQWTHVAVTFTTSSSSCYLNGELRAINAQARANFPLPFAVGIHSANPSDSSTPWKGAIDEVRIYNSTRTQAQIQNDLKTYGPTTDTNLVAYYDFNNLTTSTTTVNNQKSGADQTLTKLDFINQNFTVENIASEASSGTKKVITFNRTFLTADGGWTVPTGVTTLEYLIVGGGGGGGLSTATNHGGGGGGAGGYRTNVSGAISGGNTSAESVFTVSSSIYSVVVGHAGIGQKNSTYAASNGGDSTFASLTALGGGRGADYFNFASTTGGSGGGGAVTRNSTRDIGANGTTGQGFSGGNAQAGDYDPNSGGGGGAGGPGGIGSSSGGGAGGSGLSSSITGAAVTRATGGAGGSGTTSQTGADGAANTGNGGGGGSAISGVTGPGGNGGTGVVIISYATTATITTQPVGQTKFAGETATFSVAATGNALSYQWQLSTNNGSTWSDISGATTTSYTTGALALSDHKKQYRVKVSSTVNGATSEVLSNAALLRVPSPILSYNASDTNSYDAGSNTPTTVKDLSGNNRNGTTTNGTNSQSLGFNNTTGALTFSGGASSSGPFIDLPDLNSSAFSTDGITIDFEANFGSANMWERIFDFKDNDGTLDNIFVSRNGTTNEFWFEIYNNGLSKGVCRADGEISNNTLARWTVTLDGTTCNIYKDSVLVETASYTSLPSSVTWSNNFIGKSNVSSDNSLEGSILSFRLYAGAYTPAQIGSFNYKTISYNPNNGSTITNATRYTSGQVRLPANNVTNRTNYQFSGWYSEASATTKVGDASTLYTPTTSQTIYAGWNPNLCTTVTSDITSGGKAYKVVKILQTDTCIWRVPNGVTAVDTLLVGGGAGGLPDGGGGGGGGGGYSASGISVTQGTDVVVDVGAGGQNGGNSSTTNGQNTTIDLNSDGTLDATANGGGIGGTYGQLGYGGAGGSSSTGLVGGNGGRGPGDTTTAGKAGLAGSNGFQSNITGTNYYYGGGGGGGVASQSNGSPSGVTIDWAWPGKGGGGPGASMQATNSGPWSWNYNANDTVDYSVTAFGSFPTRSAYCVGNTSYAKATSGWPGLNGTGGGGGGGAAYGDGCAAVPNTFDDGERTEGGSGGSGVAIFRYEVPSFAVTLVENGGSTVADTAFAMGGSIAQPANPLRDGYDFAGWSATDGGTVISSWPYSPGVDQPISLYAKWTAKSFSVTFNSNGGSSVSPTTFLADGSISAPASPNKSGATFDGWAISAGGPAVSFSYSPGVYENVTFFAKWKTIAATGKVCDGSFTENNLTASAGHGKVFYIDTGQGQEIDAGYVAYGIKSTSARNDLWVELSGFSGGVMSLADPSTSAMPLGSVTANGTGTAFFMLKATGATTTAQSHILRVYNQKPSIGNPAPLYECTFTFNRVEETIKAAANKVDSVVSTTVSSIGSTMTVTVLGDSGTIGQGNDVDGRMFWLIPAARSSWPVNAVRLEKTELSMYSTQSARDNNGTAINTFTNTLRINNSTGLTSNSRQYWKAVYTFRAIGVAASSAPIIPIAMISSGTQIKHTDVQALLAATNNQSLDLTNPEVKLAVTKNVSPTSEVRSDGTTRFSYSVNLVNSGTSDLIIDEVVDTPDEKASYVTGSAKYDNVAISDPGKVGITNSISFTGPLTVAANSTRTITYSMAIETCKIGQSYSLNNTATARSGVVVIGSGSATQSVVTVNGNCGQTQTQVIVEDEPIPPDVTTSPATSVTKNSATINGLIDPNSVTGRSLRFNYSTSLTLSSATAVNLSDTSGSSTPYAVTNNLTGLSPNTTYYYRLEVLVDGVWKLGEILSFTTLPEPAAPVADTTAVTSISDTGTNATFNGTIDANQWVDGTKIKFEYQASNVCPAVSGSPTSTGFLQDESGTPSDAFATGSNPAAFNYSVTGLTANTNYCVRIVGFYKGDGQSDWLTRAEGDWVSFTTTAKSPQNIVWTTNVQSVPAGTTNFSVDADADSNLGVTYTSVDPTICTVNSSTGAVTLIATSGNCVITATQSGNSSFYAAEPQSFSFAIIPPVITTTSLATGTYGSSYSQTINATDGNGTYDTWTISSGELPPGLTLNPNTGEISGTPTIAGIYTIVVTTKSNGVVSAPQTLTITINKVVLTVTASSHTVTYGASVPSITASYNNSQFISPDTSSTLSTGGNVPPTCSTTYTATTNANTSGVTTTCANAWATNYTFTYVSGSVTINPLAVTITALNAAKKVGENDPTNSYRLSPTLPAGQTISNVLVNGLVTYSRANGETPGEYVITPSGTSVASSNYTTNFVTGKLTITDKTTPVLDIPTHSPITFGTDLTGQLNATGKHNGSTVPGTYTYTYVNSSGQTVTLTDATKLPAGNYIILVTFTPTDGSTYHGPIQGSFTLTVNKFALRVKALKAAKQNLILDTKTQVSSDPELKYVVGPNLPAGQTLSDVFPNGVEVARQNAGTPAGTYPTVNAAITGKEQAGTYLATPQADVSSNYAVTFEDDDFVITEKIVPTIQTTDSTKTVNDSVGTSRLNAAAKHLNNGVAGVFEYAYEDADGNDVVVTSATKLPLGVYTIKTKFTPSDLDTYYGPVYGVMVLTVTPYVEPTPDPDPNDEPTAGPTTPAVTPTTTPTVAVTTPTVSPSPTATRRGGNNNAAPAPRQSPKPAPKPSATPSPTPTKNGPYLSTKPVLPGIGGLLNLSPSTPAPSASKSATPSGTAKPAPSATQSPAVTPVIPAKTTIDIGIGLQPLTTELATNADNSRVQGERSLDELAQEKLVGFYPPGAGVRIEVLGARSGARFVLSDAAEVDVKALMAAMSRSIETQAADFFTIKNLSTTPAPQFPTKWTAEEQAGLNEFFAGAGLANPLSLADVNYPEIKNWVGVEAKASTYVPGSTVYLTVTSTPLVLAAAIVDENGEVEISGSIPVEFLGAGEHRVRLVGTRTLDGVYVDNNGEVQVSTETLQEIQRFDLGTQATIGLIGNNAEGGIHAAMRVIPLEPTAPWWTIALVSVIGLILIGLRRRGIISTKQQRFIAIGVLVVATLPAVILGWISTVTQVVWVGIALSIGLNVATWFTKARNKLTG